MILGDQQQVARIRTIFFDGSLKRLNAERVKGRIQIIKAARKKIGIHWRQLKTGVTQIHRGIKRRRVILPGAPEPPLNCSGLIQKALLQRQEGAGERRRQMWNHI